MYVPLRVHGHHSLLTGVDSPEELLRRARALGIGALALADVDTTAGQVELVQAARRLAEADPARAVRPILAAEISAAPVRDAARSTRNTSANAQGARTAARDARASAREAPGRLVAIVRTAEGYRNLCKLVSARRLGGDPGDPDEPLEGPETFQRVECAVRFQEGLTYLVDHPRLAFALAGKVPAEQLFVAISAAALAKRPIAAGRRRVRAGESRNVYVSAPPKRVLAVRERTDDDALDGSESYKVPPPPRAVPALDLVEAARAAGLATVAAPDVYYASPGGARDHRVRVAIKHNALVHDLPESWLAEGPAHLLSPAEVEALFADLPEAAGPFEPRVRGGAVARSLAIAEGASFAPELGGVVFPEVELEPHETPYSKLVELAFAGARERYRPLRPEVVRRLDFELTAIEELGFAAYFLLVRKIHDFAVREKIPCVGRGSAADSLVAYCLGLTDADPLRYRLPFERFLNPARKDRPDIDLDFCWRRRDRVLQHTYEAFGPERTAMISTLNRFGLRSAFREAALVEGLPPVEVNRWSRRLPWGIAGADEGGNFDGEAVVPPAERSESAAQAYPSGSESAARAFDAPSPNAADASDRDPTNERDEATSSTRAGEAARFALGALDALPEHLRGNQVALALLSVPECRDFPFDDERFARVLAAAEALIDTPRHFGLHPGGVVATPGPITDWVACQRAAKGVVVTQHDKDGVERLGLVKMDLLGNRALTVLDDCLELLREAGIEPPDLTALREDDARTAELLRRGLTLGCFQVESPGMRNLLKQTGAHTMDDVIQAVALIRPGPAGSGMKDAYVRRFRGLEEPRAPHPRLTELLWDTHGVMLYQEDVMQVASWLAGMDLTEADLLRRSLQKRREGTLAPLARRFEEGCVANGVARADARRVWELVSNFASFGFCKAHAVTYGRIAYRAVYLKAHHPGAYLAAFLNSRTGYYETRVYVEEARRLGVPILPPDVNESGEEWRYGSGGAGGSVGTLRVGLGQVKGLGEATRARILAERARRAFTSLPDFLERTGAHTDEAEHLIQCGAFDAFDHTRPELSWRLHLLRAPERGVPRDVRAAGGLDRGRIDACRSTPGARTAEAIVRARHAGGWRGAGIGLGAAELAPGECASLFPAPETPALVLPRLPDVDARRRAQIEFELLGITVALHPTELFPCEAQAAGVVRIACAELDRHAGRRVALVGWLDASRRVRTADGRWMRFLTLEDTTGIAEAVLFPDVYARDGHRLVSRGPFCISGTVLDQMGACTLHVERIH